MGENSQENILNSEENSKLRRNSSILGKTFNSGENS